MFHEISNGLTEAMHLIDTADGEFILFVIAYICFASFIVSGLLRATYFGWGVAASCLVLYLAHAWPLLGDQTPIAYIGLAARALHASVLGLAIGWVVGAITELLFWQSLGPFYLGLRTFCLGIARRLARHRASVGEFETEYRRDWQRQQRRERRLRNMPQLPRRYVSLREHIYKLLQELVEVVRPPSNQPDLQAESTLETIVERCQQRREEISQLTLPEPMKEQLLRWLNREQTQQLHQTLTENQS